MTTTPNGKQQPDVFALSYVQVLIRWYENKCLFCTKMYKFCVIHVRKTLSSSEYQNPTQTFWTQVHNVFFLLSVWLYHLAKVVLLVAILQDTHTLCAVQIKGRVPSQAHVCSFHRQWAGDKQSQVKQDGQMWMGKEQGSVKMNNYKWCTCRKWTSTKANDLFILWLSC